MYSGSRGAEKALPVREGLRIGGRGLPQSRRAPLYRRPRPVRDTTLRHSLARLLSPSSFTSPFVLLLRIFFSHFLFLFFFSFSPPWGKLLPAFISPPASPPTLSILLHEPRPLVWPGCCFRPHPLIIHFLTRAIAELLIRFFVLLFFFLPFGFFLSRKKKIYIYIYHAYN